MSKAILGPPTPLRRTLHPVAICPLCHGPGLRGNRDSQSCPTCGYLRSAGSTTYRVRMANTLVEDLLKAARGSQMSLKEYAGEVLECHVAGLRCHPPHGERAEGERLDL